MEVGIQSFNYSKLKGKIVEMYGSQAKFAEVLDISSASLSKKMNGKTDWTQSEIMCACNHLLIDKSDVAAYFFSTEVKQT